MSYQTQIKVCSYDMQPDKTIKPSSLLKYFQQAAGDDLDQYGLTYEMLREKNMAFVLVKMNLQIYGEIGLNDQLILSTYPRRTSGAQFIRDFVVERLSQDSLSLKRDKVCECTTSWVLMDFINRRALRPASLPYAIPVSEEQPVYLSLFRTIVLNGELEQLDHRTIYYSQLDENDHMNNTVFADIAGDYMPTEIRHAGRRIKGLEIHFASEGQLGNQLAVVRAWEPERNGYCLKVDNLSTGKICFEARVVFSDLQPDSKE